MLTADLYGNQRIAGGTVDIGAIEGATAATVGVTFTVQSLANTVAVDGVLTFTEAFQAANTNQAVGDASAGSFANVDTIQFAGGLTGTALLAGTPLSIHGNLAIAGPGESSLSFDAGGLSQVVEVRPGADVKITDVTLTSGASDVANPVTKRRYLYGGAVTNYGALQLERDTISSSAAISYGAGGGIYNFRSLNIVDSTIANNTARRGGGILNVGELTLTTSDVAANSVTAQGGGLFVSGNGTTVSNSTFSSNAAFQGAAIYNSSISLLISDSTLSSNVAGISGGGLYQNGGSATVLRSMIVGNRAFHDHL